MPLVNQCYAKFWRSIQALINTSSKHVRYTFLNRQFFSLKTLLILHLRERFASVQGQVRVLPALWQFRRLWGGSSGSFPTARSVGSLELQSHRRLVCPQGVLWQMGTVNSAVDTCYLCSVISHCSDFPEPAVRFGTRYVSIYPPSYTTGEARGSLS